MASFRFGDVGFREMCVEMQCKLGVKPSQFGGAALLAVVGRKRYSSSQDAGHCSVGWKFLQRYPNGAKLGRKSVFTGSSREKCVFEKSSKNAIATRCSCSVLVLGRKMLMLILRCRRGRGKTTTTDDIDDAVDNQTDNDIIILNNEGLR